MHEYLIPITNSCTLVTLSYAALKLRNRVAGGANEWVLVPLFTGLASILMMLLPIPVESIFALDFRHIPIMMAGLCFGLPMALLSVIAPAAFSVWQAHPYLLYDMLQSLILPALISSFVHQRNYRSGFERIRPAAALQMAFSLFLAKVAIGYAATTAPWPDYALMNGCMFAITMLCLLALIAMHNDEHKSWLLQRQLELEANQDRLTGLPNVRGFLEIADSALKKRRISILMIDIDNFKNYNDTLGHLQGDRLLREAGALLRTIIGEKDYIARYGGEEFIVMCDTIDRNMLSVLAHRLCDAVAAYPFAGREVQPGKAISVSIGITSATSAEDDLYRLIAQADYALYDSKRAGKNRYTFYEQDEAALMLS